MADENVNHPKHYNSLPATCRKCGEPIECIDVVRHQNFNKGNAIKYIWRGGIKGGSLEKHIEDLEKAVFYLQDEINLLKKKLKEEKTKT